MCVHRVETRKTEKNLGNGLKYDGEEDDSAHEALRYNDITLNLLMFADALAAILSKEIPAR